VKTRALAVLLLLSGCEGVIAYLPGDHGSHYVPPDVSCPSISPDVTLEDAALAFETDVFPALVSGSNTCVSCHDVNSNRQFIVNSNASQTFYRARSGHFFADEPGSLLSRVTNPDDSVRMPSGGPALDDATVQAIARVACTVRATEVDGGTLADEEFPRELLDGYDGGAIAGYDNPFINFVQLKNKVKAVFSDSWVRTGEDQFEKNIGLFGGVNFTTHFVEARVATPDFLLGLDVLAPDVCGAAATNHTGPFTSLDIAASIVDVPAQAESKFEAESLTLPPADQGNSITNPVGWFCWTNCTFASAYNVLAAGTYRVTVRGKATLYQGIGPLVHAQLGTVGSTTDMSFLNTTAYEEKYVDLAITDVGASAVSINFTNDGRDESIGEDRNFYVDYLKVTGPLGTGTGTARADAAKTKINSLYQRMLYRDATATEQTNAYVLLTDLQAIGTLKDAWSGVCEALVRHPDFIFTMPPSVDVAPTEPLKEKLRFIALTQRILGRPPTSAEFTKLGTDGFAALVHQLIATQEFRDYYFNRIQLRIESQGTPESDEPARMWTFITTQGRNYEEVLTADYTVDPSWQMQERPPEHGRTGVLTAKGYISNKQGLPHYNYAARVFSGFMGSIFEVPPEVFDQRGTSTATSTVAPGSLCFQCHKLLTPLSTQRLRWDDTGTYRTMLDGELIDDSDRDLVPSYEFKGQGLEAFSTRAVKKEPFIRRMINTQVKLLLGRELRYSLDERVLYKQLWDQAHASNGDMRVIIEAVANSQTFKGETP
jgi:hypothetical protein